MRIQIQKILIAGLLALGTASVAQAQNSFETVRPTAALQHDDYGATDEREPASHDSYDKDDGGSFQTNDNRKVYHTHDWN